MHDWYLLSDVLLCFSIAFLLVIGIPVWFSQLTKSK